MCPAPKKVLFIHHGGAIGGAPVSMLQLAAALDAKCYAPLVIFTQSGPILDLARDLGVPTRVVPMHSAFFYSAHVPVRMRMLVPFLFHFWPTVWTAQELVRQEHPDLVHMNTSVLVPAALGVRREEVPLIWHVREVPGSNLFMRAMHTRIIMRLADKIIASSEYVRSMLPVNAHTKVMHNALDLTRFHIDRRETRERMRAEFGLSSSNLVVGMIGSVQSVKGHYLLVEAAKEVVRCAPHVRFLIVAGDIGPEYVRSWRGRVKQIFDIPLDNTDRMRRLIAHAGLERYFVFAGFRNDIPEILSIMDILVFLSLAPEGFGRPLIEAMSMGVPVVTTEFGPSKEIVGDDAGSFVSEPTPSAIAEALVTLSRDDERRHRMGNAGRERVLHKFDLRSHVRRVQMLYEESLAQ